jgi:flavodoxin
VWKGEDRMKQKYKNFLVLYYSLTGKTRLLAERIAEILSCDIEEIVELEERRGLLGFLRSGFDAVKENFTEIKPPKTNFREYDRIIICSPVWAMNLPPAVRTFVKSFSGEFNSVE